MADGSEEADYHLLDLDEGEEEVDAPDMGLLDDEEDEQGSN